MTQVQALCGFAHDRERKRGDRFTVSPQHAEALRKKGLVRVLEDGPSAENPTTAAGEKSSASPAAPASPGKTATLSGRGGRKPKGAASS